MTLDLWSRVWEWSGQKKIVEHHNHDS